MYQVMHFFEAAHPRSRGEHAGGCSQRPRAAGSSPLARGTQRALQQRLRIPRLIPARAGNTPTRCRRGGGNQAHPRSRGEHPIIFRRAKELCDSSPLARGTPLFSRRIKWPNRLIPARAGNTFGVFLNGYHRAGSSPLARGTPEVKAGGDNGRRLIPARAGNTS